MDTDPPENEVKSIIDKMRLKADAFVKKAYDVISDISRILIGDVEENLNKSRDRDTIGRSLGRETSKRVSELEYLNSVALDPLFGNAL